MISRLCCRRTCRAGKTDVWRCTAVALGQTVLGCASVLATLLPAGNASTWMHAHDNLIEISFRQTAAHFPT